MGLRALLRKQETREDCYIRALAFYGDETLGVRLHGLTPEVSMAERVGHLRRPHGFEAARGVAQQCRGWPEDSLDDNY